MITLTKHIKQSDKWHTIYQMVLFAVKSSLAVALAWYIASMIAGDVASELASVSAIIIVQVTSLQTVRKGIERVLGIFLGLILAILVEHFLGVHFWTIIIVIFVANIVGSLLKNKGAYMATQIPISAALGLVVGSTLHDYPLLRLLGAIIGTLVGTGVSILFSPLTYAQKAHQTFTDLIMSVASTLLALADAVAVTSDTSMRQQIYTDTLDIELKIDASKESLSLGIESLRFNPWGRRMQRILINQPDTLKQLGKVARQMRRIAATVNDSKISWDEIAYEQAWSQQYADLLRMMGVILESIARYMRGAIYHNQRTENVDYFSELAILLKEAYTLCDEYEFALLEREEAIQVTAECQQQQDVRLAYRMVVRGSLLTDLRRMLNEIDDIVKNLQKGKQ